MTRRIVAISVAIALAALGTIGGIFLVVSADSRARDAINDAVTVAVATKRIAAGTPGSRVRSENMVRFEKMPRASVPSDVLTEIGDDLDKKVIITSIGPGQILMRANFGDQSQATSGLPLPEGKMAVTVQTSAPEQVAGYVQVGSQVAIFLTYKVIDPRGNSSSIEKTRVLLARVEVLAIGTNSGKTESGSSTSSKAGQLLVTVAVSQTEAERLIEGLSHGSLYLGLLTDSVEVKPGAGVDNTDADSGSTPLFR